MVLRKVCPGLDGLDDALSSKDEETINRLFGERTVSIALLLRTLLTGRGPRSGSGTGTLRTLAKETPQQAGQAQDVPKAVREMCAESLHNGEEPWPTKRPSGGVRSPVFDVLVRS